jgi:hypothetical protein
METQIIRFLTKFNKLKSEVNNAPKKLEWLCKEREDIQVLCDEVQISYQLLKRLIAIQGHKHIIIDANIEKSIKEYEQYYKVFVSKAAEPKRRRRNAAILLGEEIWIELGQTKEEYLEHLNKYIEEVNVDYHPFDPLEDDPDKLISEALDWGNLIKDIVMEDDEPERYEKAWGAWRFFTDRFYLNFSEINQRWLVAPELFIKTHVAQSEENPIIRLYGEAVRTYAIGCNVASVAMCRPLMEHILKIHYKIQENDLEKIIALAEQRFPQLKKLKMQEKRKISNNVLHNYENGTDIEEKALINYLRTIKMLVENIPK